MNILKPRFYHGIKHFRNGKLIYQSKLIGNTIPNEGLDYFLNASICGGTQLSPLYIAVFSDNYTITGGETYAIPGFTEFTEYVSATRPAWTHAGVTDQAATNSASEALFAINPAQSGTLYGSALVGGGSGATTKGDTVGGGTLISLALWPIARAYQADDEIYVTISHAAS